MTTPARADTTDATETETTAASRFDVGANRQLAARQRTAIQHEIVHLFDELAPLAVPGRRPPTLPRVTTHRWPNRCILQGPTHAVSITWFVGTRDDDTLGELLVMVWRGRVALPGSSQRAGAPAVVAATHLLLPTWTLADGWGWRAEADAGDGAIRSTDALIAECRRALESDDPADAALLARA